VSRCTLTLLYLDLNSYTDCPVKYKFRLRLATKHPRKFAFSTPEEAFILPDGLKLTLVARNANSLDEATTFHIDGGGFPTDVEAKAAGEALRNKLRLLNAILAFGLNIPVGDTPSASVSDEVKKDVASKHAGVVIDSVWGLLTFPDDGMYFEYVVGGNLEVRPSEPEYPFNALKTLWNLNVQLDGQSEEALQILGLANLETSDKAAFLTSYLALEQLVERRPRSPVAKKLIERFTAQLMKASKRKRSPIPPAEVQSLSGALSALQEESFSSALARLGRSFTNPTHIQGIPVRRFLSACTDARNRIAHHAEPMTPYPLIQLTNGLREVAIGLIWTRNQLPPLTFNTPASSISAPAGTVAVRVL
jgi:hypothetical protein